MHIAQNPALISDIIDMAWADDISFDTLQQDCGLCEVYVIKLMRANVKCGSFRRWRVRVIGCNASHKKRATRVKQEMA